MYETYITIMEIVPQNNLENIIPFELILHIAEQNPSALHAVCSVNKHANEYVNEHILKYKSMFAKEIEYDHKYTMSDGSVKGQYSVLPNGSKYGQFLEFVCANRDTLLVKGYFQNGNLEGIYQQWYTSGQKDKSCNYSNGLLYGKYREWFPE